MRAGEGKGEGMTDTSSTKWACEPASTVHTTVHVSSIPPIQWSRGLLYIARQCAIPPGPIFEVACALCLGCAHFQQ